MAVGKNITWKKGKQYHLLYYIEAVRKNIKWGKGKGVKISGKKIKRGSRKNISLNKINK